MEDEVRRAITTTYHVGGLQKRALARHELAVHAIGQVDFDQLAGHRVECIKITTKTKKITMRTKQFSRIIGTGCASLISICWLTISKTAVAHCDTEKGPVIQEARAALEKGDVTPVLKWIKKDREAEIRAAFARTQTVRAKGPEAKELADRQFIETLVRLHRAGEGAPYSGVKDEPVDPVIAMADMALQGRSADEMIREINDQMGKVIRQKLDRAVEAAKHKDDNLEAGREFVAAYVDYMHYVENVHAAIAGQQPDHAGPKAKEGCCH